MAVRNSSLAPINDTDPNFRLWGKEISDSFAAFGWIQTSDTGQVNWGTVTRPLAGNTAQGYEIWRMADSLQSGAPVYAKVEYGSGAAATTPGIWITIGQGSNGTGTITGIQTARRQIASNTSNGTLRPCVTSGDTSRIQLGLFVVDAATANVCLWASIERSKDSFGADTGEGVLFLSCSSTGSAAHRQQFLQIGVVAHGEEQSLGIFGPLFGTGAVGGKTAVYPIMLTKGIYLNPPVGALGINNGNVAINTTSAFSLYNASRTFYSLGPAVSATQRAGWSPATAMSLLVRYD